MIKSTTTEFVEKAKIKHNNIFTYEKTVYVNSKNPVIITCPLHGDFKQKPNDHLNGCRCPKCFREEQLEKRRVEAEKEFFVRVADTHGDRYDYSKVVYHKTKEPVTIICKIHGEFKQRPLNHQNGQGCPTCGNINKNKSRPYQSTWSYTDWKIAGINSKNFAGFTLYIIKATCPMTNESFIKIGKTFRTIQERFSKDHIPYNYTLMYKIQGEAIEISKLEHTLHSLFKDNKYIPVISFKGANECFSLGITNKLKDLYGNSEHTDS
jgi:hypothetical protein